MTTIEMARADSRAEERAAGLKVLLAARFNSVPADVEALVDSATIDQLLT